MFTKIRFICFLALISNFYIIHAQLVAEHSKIVICGFANWALYRPQNENFFVDDIDPDFCTHIAYAYAGLNETTNEVISLNPHSDLDLHGYERFTAHKNKHNHLKTLLAVGGYNEGSKKYSDMAANILKRSRFVQHSSEFIRQFKFDGMILDWSYPAKRGGRLADKENMLQLMKELREEFNKHDLLLIATVSKDINSINVGYNIPSLCEVVDLLYIKTYDYGISSAMKVIPSAPLRSKESQSIERTVQHLLELGALPSKLLLGIPFFGRTFITSGVGNYGDSVEEERFEGPIYKKLNFVGYREICFLLSNESSGWTSSFDTLSAQALAIQPILTQNRTKVISYDSTRSVAIKVRFAMQNDLAGVYLWSIDTDDFRGMCDSELDTFTDFENMPVESFARFGIRNSRFPLLKTANQAIILSTRSKERFTLQSIEVPDFYEYLSHYINDVSCEPSNDYVVGCFIASWSIFRKNEGHFDVETINPHLCTYLIIGHADLNMKKDDIKPLEFWENESDSSKETRFERLNVLKETNPNLKILLGIGGWEQGSRNFSILAADTTRRERFARNVLRYLRKNNLDGMDLDWQYPTMRDGESHDKMNLVGLVQSLRKELDKFNLMLTMGVHNSRDVITKAYDLPTLGNLVDYMNIHTFDYGGYWDEKVTANAPLRGEIYETVEKSIKHLLENGAPPSKIVLSLPFYGRSFITNAAGNYNDKSEGTFSSPWSNQYGAFGYNEICYLFNNQTSGWSTAWDSETAHSIARHWDEQSGNIKVIVYDSTRSIAKKVRFAMENKLAGVLVWPLDTDDFRGECNLDTNTYDDLENKNTIQHLLPKSRGYPLLKTIHNVMYLYRIIENNVLPCRPNIISRTLF